jgi:hypothetical protein
MDTLPQTILNLIGEFSAIHRDQMCDVLMEFNENERVCYNCREYIEDLGKRRTRKLMHYRYVFCSVVCGINGEEDIFEKYAIQKGFNRY